LNFIISFLESRAPLTWVLQTLDSLYAGLLLLSLRSNQEL